MKVACFYPERAVWRPIDPGSLWTSDRGLTGSELACVMHAVELRRRGHDVSLFTRLTGPGEVDGVRFRPYPEWEAAGSEDWDAMVSCMNADPFRSARPGPFRLFNQQVSDFSGCHAGWEDCVDVLAPLSHSHCQYLVGTTGYPRDRWRVLYNGVDTDVFRPGRKEPGRMIWASSHDRGLHWLLEAFPEIKRRRPNANLHVFYDFSGAHGFAKLGERDPKIAPHMRELGSRSRYVLEALRRLEGRGVHVHRSVSRRRMVEEMSRAEVLAYPLDPVHYTETFGVTVLEACAAGVVPVICTADAFGELWGEVSLSVPPPYPEHKAEFVDLVVEALGSEALRSEVSARCVKHARRFRWSDIAAGLERCLETRGESGLPAVEWGGF